MATRSQWKGFLKLALVSCPIALYGATSDEERTRFNQINPKTGNRIRQKLVDAETGAELQKADLVKGYAVGKDEYIIVTDAELEELQVESSRCIEIEQFVPRDQIDSAFFDKPYYIAPSDKVGRDAFTVIRDAMKARDVVGLARVVLSKRERPVMIEAYEGGLRVMTLRYPDELRAAASYFEDVAGIKSSAELLELAGEIIEGKIGDFEPDAFVDTYEKAVVELIAAKQAGKPPKKIAPRPQSNVVNLIDALKASAKADAKKPAAKAKPAVKAKGKKAA